VRKPNKTYFSKVIEQIKKELNATALDCNNRGPLLPKPWLINFWRVTVARVVVCPSVRLAVSHKCTVA